MTWKNMESEDDGVDMHEYHWHYNTTESDNWASIAVSSDGSLGGFMDDSWTVEYYDGKIDRERADTHPGALEAAAEYMREHIENISE